MLTKLISYCSIMSVKSKAWFWLGQFIIVCALLIFNQIKQPLKLNGDLTALFADKAQYQLSNVTDKISQAATNKQLVLVAAKDLSVAIAQADKLTQQLNELTLVKSAQTRFDQVATFDDIVQQYLPYQQQLLTLKMRTLLQGDDKDSLFAYQFSLLNQVSNQAVSLTLASDASLSLADYLSRPVLASSALTLKQDHLVAHQDNTYYVLVIFTSESSAINIDSAQQLVSQFEALIANDEAQYLYTGALFYTSKASSIGQFEMMLYGSISLLATLLLIAWVYRSMAALLATFTLVLVSFVYGYLALSQVYSEINIIAFVFSVTLIGIAVDYSFHALTQLTFAKRNIGENRSENKVSEQPLNHISASLTMSFMTTAAGYSLLIFAPFILFQQIAIFTLFGLFGALITVLLLFPLLLPLLNNAKRNLKLPSSANKVNVFQQALVGFVKQYKVVVLAVFIACLALTTTITISNDVRSFYSPDSQLKAHENQVSDLLKQKWQLGYFLVQSPTEQGVLAQEERLVAQLQPLIQQGLLSNVSAISQWLPSVKVQQEDHALLQQALKQGKFQQLQQVMPQANWKIKAEIDALVVGDWLSTDIGKMYQGQWLVDKTQSPTQFYSVVRIAGTAEVSRLQQVAKNSSAKQASVAQVHFIDKTNDISTQLALFSQQLIWLLMAAVVAAFFVFVWRYGFYMATLGVITPVFAVVFAFLLSYVIQGSLNIFNLVAGILIIALGLDYSVFYAEHGLVSKVTLTTLMSALSSVLVFAMLIFSSMSVIASFGLTIFIGVLAAFLLAPIVTLAKSDSA